MGDPAVELRVGGKTYQVVTSAAEDELQRLARKVEDALEGVIPQGRQPSPQALVLAAITLAHELEQERAMRKEEQERHKRVLHSLLGRVDRVLEESAPAPSKRTRPPTHSTTSLNSPKSPDSM